MHFPGAVGRTKLIDGRIADMRVESLSDGLQAVAGGRTVRVQFGVGWKLLSERVIPLANDDYRVDHQQHVQPDGVVELPSGGAGVVQKEGGERRLAPGTERSVADDETVVSRGSLVTLCRPLGDATVTVDRDGRAVVETDSPVVVGWTTPPDVPVGEIAVGSRDAQGVGDAITAAAAVALPEIETPRRSWPNARSATPELSLDGTGTPASEIDAPDTGVSLRVPGDDGLAYVLTTAPLGFYTGARYEVVDDAEQVQLLVDDESVLMGGDPETVDIRASIWLRRLFYVDCLAREAGPDGVQMADAADVFDALDTTAEEVYRRSLVDRVAWLTTLSDEVREAVDMLLPEWPEVVHLDPDIERVPRVSRYLSRVADIRLSDGETLSPGRMSDVDPSTAVRGQSVTDPGVRVQPAGVENDASTIWDAPGNPIHASSATGTYSGDTSVRPTPTTSSDDDGLSVVVARCGYESAEEAVERWRRRQDSLEIDLDVVGRPTCDELLDALRRDVDVVHVAAHFEGGAGVDCSDGFIGARDLEEVNAEVVVANCCGSEEWSTAAVEAGASAAASTTGPIAAETAEIDGADLSGLLSLGWSVERAVSLVRDVRDPTGWVVVGDGGVRVTDSDVTVPPRIEIDDGYILVDHRGPGVPGHWVRDVISARPHLPQRHQTQLTNDVREELLSTVESPIVVDGSLVWPPFDDEI